MVKQMGGGGGWGREIMACDALNASYINFI